MDSSNAAAPRASRAHPRGGAPRRRRRPVPTCVAAVAAVLGLGGVGCGGSSSPTPLPDVTYPSGVLEDVNAGRNTVEVHLVARKQVVRLAEGIEFEMMTYDGLFPGPMLEAKVGDRVIVHFTNQVGQPTTIHWHGLRVPQEMDGSPRIQTPIPDGGHFVYDFVVPDAATFWFHPHVDTAVQVEHGMYAPFVVHSPLDPDYDEERMIVLDDILLDENGMLAPTLGTTAERVYGRLGNMMLTNGRPSDLAVGASAEGRIERWRLLDAANARSMRLRLVGPASFRVIATDGGLLRTPYVTDELVITPGQRYDLEVTYTGPGEVRLESYATTDDGDGGVVETWSPVYVVQAASTGVVPRTIVWPDVPELPVRTPSRVATFDFELTNVPDAGPAWLINGQMAPVDPLYAFELGETVDLHLRNYSAIEHPFHLHGQFFTLMDAGTIESQRPGLRDTVLVPPGQQVHVLGLLDNPGRWMAHCHNLEHAELGMMAEITVGDAGPPPDASHAGH